MSVVTMLGEFASAGIGALGLGAVGVYIGAQTGKNKELAGLIDIAIGGVVGAASGAYLGYQVASNSVDADLPTVNEVIELQLEEGQTCQSNRYIIGSDGQVIGCAFN